MSNQTPPKPVDTNNTNDSAPETVVESVKPIGDKALLLSKNKSIGFKSGRLYLDNLDITDSKEMSPEINIEQYANSLIDKAYKEWLTQQPNFNVVFLSGAGTSFGVGKGEVKGRTLLGLWEDLEKTQGKVLTELIEKSSFDTNLKDLEALLTKAYRSYELNKDDTLKKLIDSVESFIAEKCSLEFEDVSTSAHSIFLNKITKRKVGNPRVKIFTLNYDTLFEQAASDQRFTLIDGFSFSNPKYFYGHSYDHDVVLRTGSRLKNEDNFIKKVFHLYKLHGSVDWLDNGKEVLQYPKELVKKKLEDDKGKSLKRVLIYPRDSKFELSYEQPYFELIGRFQQALRVENTFLITAGFSFCDKHIRSIIIEALKQNPSLHLLALTYPEIAGDLELQSFASIDNRIMMLAQTFENFARSYPDNQSFSNDDALEIIVSQLTKRMKK